MVFPIQNNCGEGVGTTHCANLQMFQYQPINIIISSLSGMCGTRHQKMHLHIKALEFFLFFFPILVCSPNLIK